jgi:hypothetical protein
MPSLTWTITVRSGWVGYDSWAVYADLPGGETGVWVGGPSGTAGIPTDPCEPAGTVPAAAVDDLIEAVEAHDDWTVSEPVDVTLGGYAGTRIDIELPADLPCRNDEYRVIAEDPGGDGFHPQDGANRFTFWVLDVDGQPMLFQVNSGAGSPAELVAQAEEIVTSSVITP